MCLPIGQNADEPAPSSPRDAMPSTINTRQNVTFRKLSKVWVFSSADFRGFALLMGTFKNQLLVEQRIRFVAQELFEIASKPRVIGISTHIKNGQSSKIWPLVASSSPEGSTN